MYIADLGLTLIINLTFYLQRLVSVGLIEVKLPP